MNTRRAKMYVTDVQDGDMISRTRDGEYQRVFRARMVSGVMEIMTTGGGTDTEYKFRPERMVWVVVS